jgi:WD40 repeat protein
MMNLALIDPHEVDHPDSLGVDLPPASPHYFATALGVNKWASLVAVGMSCGDIVLYDLDIKSHVKVLQKHTGAVISISWFKKGKFIATVSADKTLCIWDILTGHVLIQYALPFAPISCHLNSILK